MKAVVLVGGEGTRLRPLTYTIPKPLLPIANQPFLERQLRWLGAHGVDEAVLSLGYLPHAFESHFPDGQFGDVHLRYAVEDEPLGTAGAIRFAADGITERFVVCNGDVLTDLDLGELVRFHDARGADATITLAQVDDPSPFGVVPTRDDGEVSAFVEKPPRDRAPTNWINAGTYVLEPSVLDEIPPRLAVSIERETFPRMLEQPGRLFAMEADAYWIDIGVPAKYLQAHADVLAGRLGFPPVPGAVEREPGIWVQGTVTVDDTARIEAPVLLGAETRVERHAHVTASTVGPGCVIGAGARVRRSVLLAGARLADEAEVLDSVLGPESVLESEVIASDQTVVGEAAVVSAGVRIAGARIHVPR